MTTLAQLTSPLSVTEAQNALYAAIAARGLSTTTWKPGAVVRTLVYAFAVVLSAFSQLQALIAKSGFLALSSGAWLTLVAKYVYNVDRDIGSFASGNVRFDNAGGGVYTGGIGDLLVTNPTTGQSYRNTAPYTIGALATNVLIPFQAITLGSLGNAAASTIVSLETPLIGVTCTNPAALIGNDPETDAALQLRCSEKTGTLSPNGPQDAYAYFARSTKRLDGSSIGVTRVATIADGAGHVDVYVATASGGVTGSVGDTSTDLGVIDDAIQKNVVPVAVTETTHTATVLTIPVTYEIWVSNAAALTDAQIKTLIANAVDAWISSRPIGGDPIPGESTGRVYLSALESVIGSAVAGVLRVSITLPAGDTDVTSTQAPVAGTITAVVHQVAEGVL